MKSVKGPGTLEWFLSVQRCPRVFFEDDEVEWKSLHSMSADNLNDEEKQKITIVMDAFFALLFLAFKTVQTSQECL